MEFIIGALVVIGLGIGGYFVYRNNKKKIDMYYNIIKSLSTLPEEVKEVLRKHGISI